MTTRGATRVGVREVAARAGVSSQTVSRVLNDHPHIRDETRGRVLEAMAALRKAADELETVTDKGAWPYPSYGRLLYRV